VKRLDQLARRRGDPPATVFELLYVAAPLLIAEEQLDVPGRLPDRSRDLVRRPREVGARRARSVEPPAVD